MRDEQHEAAVEDVIESMERSAEVYGLSRSAGRVYGVLYFTDGPRSIPWLVDETGYAKSTISNVTRTLARVGLIRRRSSGGGGRRVRFEPRTDFWFVVRDALRQHVRRDVDVTRRTLDRAIDRIDSLDGDEVEADRERIRELRTTYDDLRRLLELATERSLDDLVAAIEGDDGEADGRDG